MCIWPFHKWKRLDFEFHPYMDLLLEKKVCLRCGKVKDDFAKRDRLLAEKKFWEEKRLEALKIQKIT